MSEVDNAHDALAQEIARDGVSVNEFGVRVKQHLAWDEYLDKLAGRGQFEDGSEKPSPKPMQPPLGYKRQPSMVEHIRAMVRSEQMRLAAELEGMETFEDADDFDVADPDAEPWSKYEVDDDLPSIAELRRRLAEAEEVQARKTAGQGRPEGAREALDGQAAPTGSDLPVPPEPAS